MATAEIYIYIAAIEQFIYDSEKILKELQDIKKYVLRTRKENNEIKYMGIVSGVFAIFAIAGLLFAPFKGGLSAFVVSVAVIGSVGSIAFLIIASFPDSDEAKQRIENCQNKHEKSVEKRNKITKKFAEIVQELEKRNIDYSAAVISTYTFFLNTDTSAKSFYDCVKAANQIQDAIKIGEIQTKLAKVATIGKDSEGRVTVHIPDPNKVLGAGVLTEAQKQLLIKNSEKNLMGSNTSILIKELFEINVADEVSLVSAWKTKHPLINHIDDFIRILKNSIQDNRNHLIFLKKFISVCN